MTGLFSRMGLFVDTLGYRARMQRFRKGWPAATSKDVKFYSTPKVQYRYRQRPAKSDEAETIVFTADPPATLELYDELMSVFAERFNVIVVELPAMGFSATTSKYRFGFQETNDDLAIFLEAIAGEQAIFAFSCAASMAGLDLASRRPELVSKLIVMQGGDVQAFQRWKALRDPKNILARPVFGQLAMRKFAPKRMPDWYNLVVGKTEMIPELCHCAAESFDHGALWSLASAYQEYLTPNASLRRIDLPVLSIWGHKDKSHPAENVHSVVSLSSNLKTISYEDLGHFSELEDTGRVYKDICAFLDSS